jgi:hypothetical protein
MTAQERAALVSWHLAQGEALSNKEIAKMLGIASAHTAFILLCRMSRVICIYYYRGKWRKTDDFDALNQ